MSDADESAQRVDDVELDYRQGKIIEEAQANSIKANDALRKMMTEEILPLFKTINKYVLLIVGIAMAIDFCLVFTGLANADQRLINSNVIMTLIGAATVQLGSIMFTISAYLFPKT
ncbi:hypothetical protein KFZ76_04105 [Methylovulum psychrotolerans]|jgi:hypothetical protein|nr:hypothetical protein [Methylovulum psychrotolerans]MBT9096895.1 hypothetical protein [Methylovulum psychrotolerans]